MRYILSLMPKYPPLNQLATWFVRVSKAVATIAITFACLQVSAAPKEYEWDKFGYSSSWFGISTTGNSTFALNPLFSSQGAVCSATRIAPVLCPNLEELQLFPAASEGFTCQTPGVPCVLTNLLAGNVVIQAGGPGSIGGGPACTHQPLTVAQTQNRAGAVGHAEFNYKTGKCNCTRTQGNGTFRPDKTLWPDHDTPYCFEPPQLTLYPYEAKYDRKAPDTVLKLSTLITRSPNVVLKKPDLKISIKTTSGVPGKLSNQVLGEDGVISFDYSFPSFDTAKTDTVVVTCASCADGADIATLNIPMAPTLVGFFNGVANTRDQANDGLVALELNTNTIKGKQNIKYELFHNQTGTGKPGDLKLGSTLHDLAEVFDQRSRELNGVLANRWETFWDITGASHASTTSGIGGLLSLLGIKAIDLALLVDSIFNDMLGQFVASFAKILANPPTAADLAAHNAKLLKYAEEGYPVVLIAHSQGNLFVNRAFDTLRAAKPGAPAQVVHIAPASPTLRGDYVLAGVDFVINGLRLLGPSSVPLANISIPISKSDVSGHKLVETYLDSTRAALARVKNMLKSAIEGI